jgi:hypothetical protein
VNRPQYNNNNMSNTLEAFQNSLEELNQQFQNTVQLGFDFVKLEVESFLNLSSPTASSPDQDNNPMANIQAQFDSLRDQFQEKAQEKIREVETKAQDFIHSATNQPRKTTMSQPKVTIIMDEHDVPTAAGVGTSQMGANFNNPQPTASGIAPGQ